MNRLRVDGRPADERGLRRGRRYRREPAVPVDREPSASAAYWPRVAGEPPVFMNNPERIRCREYDFV